MTLGGDPFDVAASGEVFLNQQVVGCKDLGLDSAADTAFGAAVLNWWDMTTSSDGMLDEDFGGLNDVDMGRHYDPVRVTITAFTADATDLSWTTGSPVPVEYYCVITNDQDGTVIVIDAADLSTGTAAHGLNTDAVATMACYGIGMPALAQATVPAP